MIGYIILGEFLSLMFCWYPDNKPFFEWLGWFNFGVMLILLMFYEELENSYMYGEKVK